jgi:hypothetical protein
MFAVTKSIPLGEMQQLQLRAPAAGGRQIPGL